MAPLSRFEAEIQSHFENELGPLIGHRVRDSGVQKEADERPFSHTVCPRSAT